MKLVAQFICSRVIIGYSNSRALSEANCKVNEDVKGLKRQTLWYINEAPVLTMGTMLSIEFPLNLLPTLDGLEVRR